MDITNSTDVDTQYKVTGGGGPPMGDDHYHHKDFPMDEAARWPTLHAGSQVSLNPRSAGPWTVYFYVQGKGYTVTTESSDNRLMLMRSGSDFHVQVG